MLNPILYARGGVLRLLMGMIVLYIAEPYVNLYYYNKDIENIMILLYYKEFINLTKQNIYKI